MKPLYSAACCRFAARLAAHMARDPGARRRYVYEIADDAFAVATALTSKPRREALANSILLPYSGSVAKGARGVQFVGYTEDPSRTIFVKD